MKILEARPDSYDRRLFKSSRGRSLKVKEEVATEVPPGSNVLEIGCGTGELARILVTRGCTVFGFDLSESMISTAQRRIEMQGLEQKVSVCQMGVESMDTLPECGYDVVVSTLVFSELTDDERRFVLEQARRVLRDGGRLVIADEVVPRSTMRKALYSLIRWPLLAMTYLVTGTSTQGIADLVGEIVGAGFIVEKEIRSHGDSFALVVAHTAT